MAASAAATPSRANQTTRTAPTDTNEQTVTKSLVTRDFDLTIHAFFPVPTAPAKFNPTSAMQQLLRIKPSLVLRTPCNDAQIVLATMPLPTGEKAFKKFCTISNPRAERQNPTHVCIGCHVLSNRSLGNIKFHSAENHLLAWLKKAKVFIESDSLGVERPVTFGYFTKLDPSITHLANFRDNLINQLMLVEIDAETAVTLAPFLKKEQLEAMSNGDDYVPVLPNFEVYKTRLSYGKAPSQTKTEVLGVKGAPKDVKLLSEFFMRLTSENGNDPRDGVFIAKGAAHLLGSSVYEQVLKDNNFFINNLATIPVNLEYPAWFAVIELTQQSETEPISLHEHLLRQPWFLRLESAGRNKCLITTNRSNLPEARKWIDENLQRLIRHSIPPGIDPPESALPRRLDKPVYTATSHTYADILKKQFSLDNTTTDIATANATTRPARKRQATFIDYDSDNSAEYPPLTVNQAATIPIKTGNNTAAQMDNSVLVLLKTELNQLKEAITMAVAQIKEAVATIPVMKSTTHTQHATTETDQIMNHAPEDATLTPLDIHSFIADLKHELATVFKETRAMLQQQTPAVPSRAMETDATPTQTSIDLPALIKDLKKDIANIAHETRTLLNQPLTAMMELDNLSSIT